MDHEREESVSADGDRTVGMLLALVVIVIVTAALIAIFGIPARQDCTYEHYGKGAFSASCHRHVQ
jgi:hypothetical protein